LFLYCRDKIHIAIPAVAQFCRPTHGGLAKTANMNGQRFLYRLWLEPDLRKIEKLSVKFWMVLLKQGAQSANHLIQLAATRCPVIVRECIFVRCPTQADAQIQPPA